MQRAFLNLIFWVTIAALITQTIFMWSEVDGMQNYALSTLHWIWVTSAAAVCMSIAIGMSKHDWKQALLGMAVVAICLSAASFLSSGVAPPMP